MSKIYDVAVIGGGATGTGIARDAALRGLKTILIEKKTSLPAQQAHAAA